MALAISLHQTIAEWVDALVAHVSVQLRRGVEKKGEAVLAVSGGSTPQPIFTALAQQPLPWQDITITLVDERWVNPSDAASNELLVRDYLLCNWAEKANFVPLKTDHLQPVDAVPAVHTRLAALPSPFDVVMLGMGVDGHTASFFRHSEEYARAVALEGNAHCCGITLPAGIHARMTLTLPTILRAHQIVFHLTGEKKWQLLHDALSGKGDELPVSRVIHQTQTPVSVYHCVRMA